MIRRALLFSLWTLIAFPEDCLASFTYKTSSANVLAKNTDQQDRRFQVPGRLFLNGEEDVDEENDLKRLGKSLNLDSLEKAVNSKDTSDLFRSKDDDKEGRHNSRGDSPIHLSQKRVLRRRKGPTLSVVNPLEILRQRLMLEMARRRIQENQQQIVANADFLENLGKRSAPDEWQKNALKADSKVDEYVR